jgi:hypothetical protein
MSDQDHFDAEAFWAGLNPAIQTQLGVLACGLLFCVTGRERTETAGENNLYFAAECQAFNQLDQLFEEHAPLMPLDGSLPLPPIDLLLKERACRVCGCTEHRACVDDMGKACAWVEPDLCSACPPLATCK